MSQILTSIFGLAGMIWVGFMIVAMIGVMSLAPKGQKMRTYNQLSMWQFGQIRADLGPAVEPHLKIMRRGGYAFLALFAVVIVVAAVALFLNAGAATG